MIWCVLCCCVVVCASEICARWCALRSVYARGLPSMLPSMLLGWMCAPLPCVSLLEAKGALARCVRSASMCEVRRWWHLSALWLSVQRTSSLPSLWGLGALVVVRLTRGVLYDGASLRCS